MADATLIDQLNGGSPKGSGVYSGSMTYDALADGLSHTYSFYSVGVDDQQKAQATPASADVTFTGITYREPLAVANFAVEKGIAERSFIQYLDVDFNQSVSSARLARRCKAWQQGWPAPTQAYVELLWYGENLTSSSIPRERQPLQRRHDRLGEPERQRSLDQLRTNGITSLLTEKGVRGRASHDHSATAGTPWASIPPATRAMVRSSGCPSSAFSGETNGDRTVTGPYITAGTDAYTVYMPKGNRARCSMPTSTATGRSTARTSPRRSRPGRLRRSTAPQASRSSSYSSVRPSRCRRTPSGHAGRGSGPVARGRSTPGRRRAWMPPTCARLESVPVQVGNLGTSILGLEAAGVITINQTAAGYNWYVGAGTGSGPAFGPSGPDGESIAVPGQPGGQRA